MTVVEDPIPTVVSLFQRWYSFVMPNYCYNTMSLTGNKKEIRKFIKDITVKENEYDINHLVPIDDDCAEDVWGSKWGAFDIEGDMAEENPTINYQSAWSPCDKLIQNISVQYPNVIFSVISTEESKAFVIYEIYHAGKTVERYQIDPSKNRTPELEELYEEAEESDYYEKYYEAETDWYEDLEHRAWLDCKDVSKQYEKYLVKAKRQKREGRKIDEFIPE